MSDLNSLHNILKQINVFNINNKDRTISVIKVGHYNNFISSALYNKFQIRFNYKNNTYIFEISTNYRNESLLFLRKTMNHNNMLISYVDNSVVAESIEYLDRVTTS